MANVISNLPMPVFNGPGAAVDVSAMGREKSIVITGSFQGATITVEVSEEAGGAGAYAPLYTFQTGDQKQVIAVAARFMRVNVSGRKTTVPFTATADVGADDMGATFAVLTLPANNGPGANVNVSTLGQFTTFVVGGSFPGAVVQIEASDDGVDFAPVTTFAGYGGLYSTVLTADWFRTNVSGRKASVPFSASVAVGAIVDPTVPPPQVPLPGGSTCYIYQPGGGQTGPGTFDTWATLMAALAVARAQANGGGCYTIQFDDSITSPAVIPAGAWDMTDVTWEGTLKTTAVSIADGAAFTKLRMFAGPLAITNNNTVTPASTDLANGELVVARQTSFNTVRGGQPFFRATGVGAGQTAKVFLYNSSDLGALAAGTVFSFPTAGSTLALALDNASTIADPGVLSGGGTSTLSIQTASLETLPTVFTNWAGTVSTPVVNVGPSLVPQPYLAAAAIAPFASAFGQWLRFNAGGGAVAENLPAISAAAGTVSGPGCFVAVTEQGGGTLTVAPVGGDTIQGAVAAVTVPANGSMFLVSDGVSDWRILASFSSGGTTAGESGCLIFQPGGTQTGPGTFNSWTALMTHLAALRAAANGGGCYTIQFDDTITTPAVVPAGTYDMTDVMWEGGSTNFGTAVSIADGAHFTKLRSFSNNLNIVNHNTATAACTDNGVGEILSLRQTTIETVAGGKSMFDATAAGASAFTICLLYESASLGVTQTGPVFNFPNGGGSELFIIKEGSSSVAVPGCLVGVAGTVLEIATSSLQSLETVFPNWAGTVSAPRLDVPPSLLPHPYLGASASASYTAFTSQWARFTTAGGSITQGMPTISTATGTFSGPGCFFLVSESSGTGGTLTLQPGAGDTIDGSAASISVPAGGSMLFISDGVSNWTIVAQAGNRRLAPPEKWVQNGVIANQNNVAMAALVSTNFDTIAMIRSGSIVGISTRFTTPVTAGTATIKATINGVASTLSVVSTNASNASGGQSTERTGIDTFVAGDLIGMQISTSAGFLPITANVEAWLEIEESS